MGLALLTALATIAIGLSELSVVPGVAAWLVVAAGGIHAWRMAGKIDGTRLRLLDDGRWSVLAPAADEVTATLVEATVLGPLIAMRLLRSDEGQVALALLPDSASSDSLRALRVWLGDAHAFETNEDATTK
jgi:hypothetical protein